MSTPESTVSASSRPWWAAEHCDLDADDLAYLFPRTHGRPKPARQEKAVDVREEKPATAKPTPLLGVSRGDDRPSDRFPHRTVVAHANRDTVTNSIVTGAAAHPLLDAGDRSARRTAASSVVAAMPDAAVARLKGRLGAIHSHHGSGSVSKSFYTSVAGDGSPVASNERDVVAGWYAPGRGALHMDGGDTGHVLAHELGHALDQNRGGTEYELSSHPEFLKAHAAELANGDLSDYAVDEPAEGFAEFCRLLYAHPGGHTLAEKHFPLTSAFFRRNGLMHPARVGTQAKATAPQPGGKPKKFPAPMPDVSSPPAPVEENDEAAQHPAVSSSPNVPGAAPSDANSGGGTTENDFHQLLDANPDDHHTRMVLADFLEERNDPRAAGYRALGQSGKHPNHWKPPSDDQIQTYPEEWGWGQNENYHYRDRQDVQHLMLPKDWMGHIVSSHPRYSSFDAEFWRHHQTRREADDAAALAFAKLHPERQQAIMNTPVGTQVKALPPGGKPKDSVSD